jgi:predicted ATPase/class 3 adenylate cyclase/DNA-binding CsgD family transcriptional regulator
MASDVVPDFHDQGESFGEVGDVPESSGPLPTGTVTFLLTDIEGSTAAWERAPEATAAAVAEHYRLLDRAITAHGGQRPVEQGEGDSVVAVFTRATDAVAAAVDTQRLLAGLGLGVRMAVHTGEIELRDEGNYFGPTVIRCARLRSIGHGGQILVSDATRLLVGGQLPTGSWLVDLGTHRLKDLGRAEHVWQLCSADCRADFPPLRSLDAFGHNLPTRLTRLVGRESDTVAVTTALGDSRLVTLVGTGGVGKTRLALQVAAELVDQFDGGVWWVELASLSDPSSMPGAVLAAMGVPVQPGVRPVRSLGDQLGGRQALFVLDNCEHLIGSCARFADELLTALPAVIVMATSREPLGVPGETVWRVPSLELPAVTRSHSAESIEVSDAARLFVERARHARPGLILTNEAANAVAQICRRLDGIPLSIELAAARCRNLSVEQIARELDDRFRLLTGGARTVLARQQTLKASIDWSHDLLDTGERAALRRLGVFVGAFTMDAAEAVVGGFGDVDPYGVFDLVDRLADKSLIAIDEVDHDGESRYRLLETIRHYALDRLVDAGELTAARDAHALFWTRWSESRNVFFECALALLAEVQRNLANLEAAARWACISRPAQLQPLMLAIALFVQVEDDEDGDGLFESALAALDGQDDVAWAHVAMATTFARAMTWIAHPDTELPARADAIATRHNLPLIHAALTLVAAARKSGDSDGLAAAAARYAIAGSASWSAFATAFAARVLAASGQLDGAEELLSVGLVRTSTADYSQPSLVGARVQIAVVRGMLTDVARSAQGGLDGYPPGSFKLSTFVCLAYENLARVAFFSGEHDVLAWTVARLERAAKGPSTRRIHTIAAAHLRLLDGPDATLGERVIRSATGGGLLQRETPYLSIAAADRDWIATDRAAIAGYAAGGDLRVQCFVHFADGVLALDDHDDHDAEAHWHDLLALASERGFGLLWIDALEGLALCAARSGAAEEAARLAGAAAVARDERSYRYRYPHLTELPEGSEEGRALSLQEATAYIRRARGERGRPTTGWAALTPTELEVATAVADGLTNQQTAERLFMSVPTVKTHLRHIFDKLTIGNRSQLVAVVANRKR